jgi:hypothetical protein
MTARIAAAWVVALAAAVGVAGCAGQRASATDAPERFHPVSGALTTTLQAPMDQAWNAAQGAVEELQFRAGTKTKDALTALMTAKTADNGEVKIRLDKRSEGVTWVRIGVGPFGKEATARAVLQKIKEKL